MNKQIEKRISSLENKENPPNIKVLYTGVDVEPDPPEPGVVYVWFDKVMMSNKEKDRRGIPRNTWDEELRQRDLEIRRK